MFKHNIPEFLRTFDLVTGKQMPYACALGLTRTVKSMQSGIRESLPKDFIIRNTWTAKGIRITPARKKDLHNMSAEVYTKDDYIAQHEEDTVKTPRGHHLTVPQGIRRNVRTIVKRMNRVRAVLQRPDVFKATLKGNSNPGVYQRLDRPGRPRSSTKRLKKLYNLTTEATIKKRLGFSEKAHKVAEREAYINFASAINDALGY